MPTITELIVKEIQSKVSSREKMHKILDLVMDTEDFQVKFDNMTYKQSAETTRRIAVLDWEFKRFSDVDKDLDGSLDDCIKYIEYHKSPMPEGKSFGIGVDECGK